jgi:hypothetical protein
MQQDSGSTLHEQQIEIYRAGQVAAAAPMNSFMQSHGTSNDNDTFGQDLEEALNSGYAKGTNGESQQGALPKI